MQVEYKWWNRFNRDNLKHKFYMAHNFRRKHDSFLIVYFMTLFGGYIQMTFVFGILNRGIQNWNLCNFEILDIHIFFKLNPFGTCEGTIL
jgi:hypothetical protein